MVVARVSFEATAWGVRKSDYSGGQILLPHSAVLLEMS